MHPVKSLGGMSLLSGKLIHNNIPMTTAGKFKEKRLNGLERSASSSYFGLELLQRGSVAIVPASTVQIKQNNLSNGGATAKLRRDKSPQDDAVWMGVRHNSYSAISEDKKPAGYLQSGTATKTKISRNEAKGSTTENSAKEGLAVRLLAKKQSLVGTATVKKPTSKKRQATNNLISKLGMLGTLNKSSSRNVDNKLFSRKSSNAVQMANLHGKMSPGSHLSQLEHFHVDFLDHSTTKRPTQTPLSLLASKNSNSNGQPYQLTQDRLERSLSGGKLSRHSQPMSQAILVRQGSSLSTSFDQNMPNNKKNFEEIQKKMSDVLLRLDEVLKKKEKEEDEKTKKFESIARENGILREKIRALQRKNPLQS